MLRSQVDPLPRHGNHAKEEGVLWERARSGDVDAFERLMESHFGRLFQLALRMVGNREDAEEVVQGTFDRAYRSRKRFRGGSSFTTWITRITINLCIDLERSRGNRPAHESLSDRSTTGVDPQAPAPTPSRQAEQRELLRQVAFELQELQPRLRSALILRVFEQMPYHKVAEVLGTSVRSARMYVYEARQTLMLRLGASLDEELRP